MNTPLRLVPAPDKQNNPSPNSGESCQKIAQDGGAIFGEDPLKAIQFALQFKLVHPEHLVQSDVELVRQDLKKLLPQSSMEEKSDADVVRLYTEWIVRGK